MGNKNKEYNHIIMYSSQMLANAALARSMVAPMTVGDPVVNALRRSTALNGWTGANWNGLGGWNNGWTGATGWPYNGWNNGWNNGWTGTTGWPYNGWTGANAWTGNTSWPYSGVNNWTGGYPWANNWNRTTTGYPWTNNWNRYGAGYPWTGLNGYNGWNWGLNGALRRSQVLATKLI